MLKIGIIGVGSISSFHIQAIQESAKARLVAFCDINLDRLQTKGSQYGVNQLYTDYNELLANDQIDAVVICTWNDSHVNIATAALKAGKHVFVEKPLSRRITADAIELGKLAESTDKVASVGMVRRYADNARVLKQWIDSGKMGDIYYGKASLMRRLGHPGGWFGQQAISGGGPMVDLGVHLLDIVWYLMGKPKPTTVSANTASYLGDRGHIGYLSYYQAADQLDQPSNVEDFANALIRFENGASFYLETSYTMHTPKDDLLIQMAGSNGGAILEPSLQLVTEENGVILNAEPQIDFPSFHNHAYKRELDGFIDACVEGKPNETPIADGLTVLSILDSIYQSAREKREITL
ncbi:Gfo/Idh/MocA family protein [Fundicoccus sp. Sow4_H7]|uniref:Gfo/Idh/MocA family protein n=1 Tax=Fundicoccus sp. Sow4_H7 TaxID=3438784 RepID=UPI003F9079CB